MGFLYVLSVIALYVSFVLVKKTKNEQNITNSCILGIISYLGFNIFVCMLFGFFNITTNLLFLSIIDFIVSGAFFLKIYKDKGIQKYIFCKRDIIALFIIIVMVGYIAVKQYKPLSDTIANASVDASMHYSAATNFADNMKILAKIDNQTGYNFKTMQTGAYINTGILMNLVRNILPSFQEIKTFKLFELGIFFVGILAFYMLIQDKLDSKFKFVFGMIFILLYGFGYPYTSLLYGFSYLSVAIVFSIGLFYLAKVYDKEELNIYYWIALTILMGVGIIYSYCLLVPCLYAFICLYVFIKDLKDDNSKKVLKYFSIKALVLTGLLLVVTIVSILYLVIPTFTDSDQNKLTDAIGFVGQNYNGFIIDFIFYIPFVLLYCYKTIQNKEFKYEHLALLLVVGQTVLTLIGALIGFVSAYYYYKIYYIIWILLVSCAVNVLCMLDDNKDMKFMLSSMTVLWCLIIVSALNGMEINVLQKVPMMMNDYKLQRISGIYFDTNISMVQNINMSCIVDANRVHIAEALGEQSEATLKNTLVGGMNTNHKAWVYVISGIPSGGKSINDLQKAVVETSVDDFMKDNDKKFFVLFTTDNYENTNDYEVVYSNEGGVILHKLK